MDLCHLLANKNNCRNSNQNPRAYYELPFSTWSLRVLAGFIIKDMKLIDGRISHTEIRNILLKHGIRWRQSKTVLGHSQDPEYNIKKSTLKKSDMIHQLNQSCYTKTKKDQLQRKHMEGHHGLTYNPRLKKHIR